MTEKAQQVEDAKWTIVRKELLAMGCKVSDCKGCGYPVINRQKLCRVCTGEITECARDDLDDRLATEEAT